MILFLRNDDSIDKERIEDETKIPALRRLDSCFNRFIGLKMMYLVDIGIIYLWTGLVFQLFHHSAVPLQHCKECL